MDWVAKGGALAPSQGWIAVGALRLTLRLTLRRRGRRRESGGFACAPA